MSKRSNFERVAHDKYRTPPPPIRLLLPYLPRATHFAEPCAGDGALIRTLEHHGHVCVWAGDIKPERKGIERVNALTLGRTWRRRVQAGMFITNPPWTRGTMHALIEHLPKLLPTWLLFDADWMHTGQAEPYLDRCSHIVSVGRVKWMAGTKKVGFDNSAWYFFPVHHQGGPRFTGLPRSD